MSSNVNGPSDSSSNSSSSGETEPLLTTPPHEELKKTVAPTNAHRSIHFGVVFLVLLLASFLQHHLQVVDSLHQHESGSIYQSQGEIIKSLRSEIAESVRLRAVDVAQTHESLGHEISTLRKTLREVSERNDHVQKRLERSQAELQRRSELDVVKAAKVLQTGDGWKVFSHGTPFGFGYISTTPLHASVPIHSTKISFTSHKPTKVNRNTLSPNFFSRPQIVGFKVWSTRPIGNDDWWQTRDLTEFGSGSDITFTAGGGTSGDSTYEVEIFFIRSSA